MSTKSKVGFIAFAAALALVFTLAARADTYVQPLQCVATSIALNVPTTTATVQCATVTPPPITGACAQGSTGDVPGYTAKCSGYFTLHSGTNTLKGPSSYTFSFLFGDSWPGDRSGTADSIIMGSRQFLAIPFKPSPGHTIGLSENDTYTQPKHPFTMSVSTIPGAFNNGLLPSGAKCVTSKYDTTCVANPASGVVCVRTNNPSLTLSSNGLQGATCPLDSTKTYWFNVIPAYYNTSTMQWESQFLANSMPQLGINYSQQN